MCLSFAVGLSTFQHFKFVSTLDALNFVSIKCGYRYGDVLKHIFDFISSVLVQ